MHGSFSVVCRYPIYSFFLPLYSFWRMDEFGWGNTRIVLDDGNSKKVITNSDMKFNESMIPYKKFSGGCNMHCHRDGTNGNSYTEWEAENWGDNHSKTSYDSRPDLNQSGSMYLSAPRPQLPSGSQRPSVYDYGRSESGDHDYYRDTNMIQSNSSHPNLHVPSRPSSRAISDLNRAPPQMANWRGPSQERINMFTPSNSGMHGSSVYAMTPPRADSRMAAGSGVFNRSMSPAHSLGGPPQPFNGGVRPTSTFSMATTVFAGPSMNPNPSDDELYNALRNFLSTQDLMTVTKKYVFSLLDCILVLTSSQDSS
jgi:chitin synthase